MLTESEILIPIYLFIRTDNKNIDYINEKYYKYNIINDNEDEGCSKTNIVRIQQLLQPTLKWYKNLIQIARTILTDYKISRLTLFDQLSQSCSNDSSKLKVIYQFAQKYRPDQAIYWYTKGCSIYQIVNNALRLKDVDQVHKLRYYIADLSKQLTQLKHDQQKQYSIQTELTILYRGLRQSVQQLQDLHSLIGRSIIISSFMSTSRSIDVALVFADPSDSQNAQSQALLLELHVDMSSPITNAADVATLSEFPDEKEILFDIGYKFLVHSLCFHSSYKLWHCCLISDHEKRFPIITSVDKLNMAYNTYTATNSRMKRVEERRRMHGENLDNNLLNLEMSTFWIATESIDSIRMQQKKAMLSWQVGDYKAAHENCESISKIDNINTVDQLELASYLILYGFSCHLIGKSREGLYLIKNSLAIRRQLLPATHTQLAQTYRVLGLVYAKFHSYEKALSHCHNALIYDKICSSMYKWSTSTTYRNTGLIYDSVGDYRQVTKYLSKAIDDYQECMNFWENRISSHNCCKKYVR